MFVDSCFSDFSDESEQPENLRPINQLLPANQIITKDYQPDVKPNLKLVKRQSHSQKSILAIMNLKFRDHQYQVDFDEEDTLGFEYMEKIRTNLMYLKFDNRNYFKCPANKTRYLAGLFISMEKLLKPEIRANRFLYKSLSDSNSTDYNFDIQNSFAENSLSTEPETKFSSNYEGSNLFMAIKTGSYQYDLILQNDINSRGTTQWFNFTASFHQQATYKFNIVNMTKSSSLFEKGMKVPYFSFHDKESQNKSWTRGCKNISYKKNHILRQGSTTSYYYTLHFEYVSSHKFDTVMFSSGYPYSSLNAEKFFNQIIFKRTSSLFNIEKIKICETVAGTPVYVYELVPRKNSTSKRLGTSPIFASNNHFVNSSKQTQNSSKGVVFMARQHPGQSQSSYILQGIMEFLLQHNDYENSKKNYTFYIFPMINVDGVYYGNYRTNLSGIDLNRNWKYPRRDFHAEIFYLKKHLIAANRKTPIKIIIDIHGHSSALNSFFYGNPTKKQSPKDLQNSKLFPYFCSKRVKPVSFLQSTFSVSDDKKNSARVNLNQLFPKANVYTFQNSFYGWRKGKNIVTYTMDGYRRLGKQLIRSYLDFNRIGQRNVSIKQKWQKEIQDLLQTKKAKRMQLVANDSDSEADNELLSFEEELNQLQQVDFNAKNLNSNQIKCSGSQQRPQTNANYRHYYPKSGVSRRVRHAQTIDSSKNIPKHIFKEQTNTLTPLTQSKGFLSIIKIQTKQIQKDSVRQIEESDQENMDAMDSRRTHSKRYSRASQQTSLEINAIDSPKRGTSLNNKYANEKQFLIRQRKYIQLKQMRDTSARISPRASSSFIPKNSIANQR